MPDRWWPSEDFLFGLRCRSQFIMLDAFLRFKRRFSNGKCATIESARVGARSWPGLQSRRPYGSLIHWVCTASMHSGSFSIKIVHHSSRPVILIFESSLLQQNAFAQLLDRPYLVKLVQFGTSPVRWLTVCVAEFFKPHFVLVCSFVNSVY